MRIRRINIKKWRKKKILCKHGIDEEEIRKLFEKDYFTLKSKNGCYIAIGCADRYLTVIFKERNGTAEIITAYLSSESQTRLFKRKLR